MSHIFLLGYSLVTTGALCVAMLLGTRSYRLRATDSTAAVDCAWAAVPWIFVALCAAPAMYRMS
jgi:hypothetical protein